jgi:multidrug transporter EmrE-like cation transporter
LQTLLFSLSAQSLLKRGVSNVLNGRTPSLQDFLTHDLLRVIQSPFVILGTFICGLGFFSFIFLLSRYDLGRVLPVLGGVAYLVMFVVGKVWFREATSLVNLAGIALIGVGLYLVSLHS